MADQTVITSYLQQDIATKKPPSWKSYLWDSLDLPKEERWLLFKLDACVLTFSSIGYFLKYLDLNNVTNAFLSGMEEDLEMYGNQLVTSTTIFTVGYVIGQVPFNLLLTRVSPRWVIPTLEVGWGIAVICMSSVKSYQALYALRFLVGIFESGFYPGIHYMLGSWYKPAEIGKRAMIFWLAGSIGQLFSGFLQSAAYTNLDGVYGRAGWRWLFIIDGIITFPLAVAGYFFFPNLPHSGIKTWYITEEEHELSIQRMKSIGRAGKAPWTKAKVKALFTSWHTYLLPLLYIIWNNGGPQPAMGYWLKSFNKEPPPVPGTHYSVSQINNLPNVTTGIFIVMALIWAWLSDGPFRGARWPFVYAGAVITIIGLDQLIFSILLRQMPLYENIHGRTVVYWLGNIGQGAGPLILTWTNEICSADTEKRALTVALANDLAYVVQAIAPNFVWKTTDFPAAKKGYLWSIVLQILLIVLTAIIQLLLWHDSRKRIPLKHSGNDIEADSEDMLPTLLNKQASKDVIGTSRYVATSEQRD
ncbi:pantothenate transporter, putative [Talaromyces stipitatus ATCC 10500]|uniref:Pantothenate transporter, putative n=1 Tax=Talaromyces stipitatus (strain ATCC 10500 / CBS 375.48 / QM 6759 / NRRL 1006) TaxID=441959 RepID=B8LUY5_TALSN|nr:pantothenate transporter, putative [Talaromyces stipitatus ATCC 10500]EED22606.1 pantothenate transporter, putative [Talaromyces stipitatus ATCC 10500]